MMKYRIIIEQDEEVDDLESKSDQNLSENKAPASDLDQLVDKSGSGPGSSELTFTLAILGTTLVVMGILGLAIL